MQPEQALDGWRRWHARLGSRPVILGGLSGGRSNRSFLLDSDIGKLVLRINGGPSFLPGASRKNEAVIWQAASQQGIAPPLVFADGDGQYLVSVHIDSSLSEGARADARVLDQAFGLLQRCHQLDVSAPAIDYAGHIEHYWRMIEARPRPPDPALARRRAPMLELLGSLVAADTPTGLCHHDPVIENFVGNPERLYLIDWEYAATGLQIMDWAALAVEWQIDDKAILARTGFEPDQLDMAKVLYDYLCCLWEAATT